MKKLSFYLAVIFTCSFLTFSTPAISHAQPQPYVVYEVRDGEVYEVHYDEDGKIVFIQPVE